MWQGPKVLLALLLRISWTLLYQCPSRSLTVRTETEVVLMWSAHYGVREWGRERDMGWSANCQRACVRYNSENESRLRHLPVVLENLRVQKVVAHTSSLTTDTLFLIVPYKSHSWLWWWWFFMITMSLPANRLGWTTSIQPYNLINKCLRYTPHQKKVWKTRSTWKIASFFCCWRRLWIRSAFHRRRQPIEPPLGP